MRRSHLLNEHLKGMGGRPLDSLRRKMIIRHMFLWSALLLSSIDSSNAITIMSGACQNIYGSFRSPCTNHGRRQFWMQPFLDTTSCGYCNCGGHQLWMPPSGSTSNNAARSEVLNNSPGLSHIETSLETLHEVISFLIRKRNSIGRHGDIEKRTAPSRKASQPKDKSIQESE